MFYSELFFKNQVVRKIDPNLLNQNTIFLTFDDGPDPELTIKVLDLLSKYNAKATFFLIANNAQKYPLIVKRIIREGHSIGDHSLDHNPKIFFKHINKLKQWIEYSKCSFKNQNIQTIGFRSPLGINTPRLNKAMAENNEPLILWNIRFFDSAFPLTKTKIQSKLDSIKSGDIILLHDVQKESNRKQFIVSLEYLLTNINQKFSCRTLTRELIRKSITLKH